MSIQDSDLLDLIGRVTKYKMDILFEEPCPLYDFDDTYWHDYYSKDPEN